MWVTVCDAQNDLVAVDLGQGHLINGCIAIQGFDCPLLLGSLPKLDKLYLFSQNV